MQMAPESRTDGRKPAQIRTLMCEREVLHRADGSARWTQGGTVVLASVFGPRMTFSRKEDAERAVIQVVWRPRACASGAKEKQVEALVRDAVQGAVLASLHPRTEVLLVLQVIEDDGSAVAAGINAACIALVDAGVPMQAMFSAVACAVGPEAGGGSLLLDPSLEEQQTAQACACFAFSSRGSLLQDSGGDGNSGAAAAAGLGSGGGGGAAAKQRCGAGVLAGMCEGGLGAEEYMKVVELCRAACGRVAAFQRRVLEAAYALPA